MSLNITDVRVQPLRNPKTKIIGFATVTLNGVLVIEDWKIIRKNDGDLFVAGPSKKTNDPERPWRDTVKIVNREANQAFQAAVLAAWNGNSPSRSSGSSIQQQYGQYMDSGPATQAAPPTPAQQPQGEFQFETPPPPTDADREDAPDGAAAWF